MWIPPTVAVHRVAAAQRVGGWRLLDELDRDADADLWLRMHEAELSIDFVPRVGAVKLPASVRQGVYTDRPAHEQAAWAARIAAEADLEAAEGIPALLRSRRPTLATVAGHASTRGVLVTLGRELGRRATRFGRTTAEAGQGAATGPGYRRRFEQRLRYKGAADD